MPSANLTRACAGRRRGDAAGDARTAWMNRSPISDAELLVELTDAGRTRDVDLSHVAADDIQSHEQHALGRERGPDLADEPAVTIIQRPPDALGAGREVAAIVVRRWGCGRARRGRARRRSRSTRESPGLHDVRNVTLHDREALTIVCQRLEHDIDVLVIALEHKNGASPHAVERLADDPAVLAQESVHFAPCRA